MIKIDNYVKFLRGTPTAYNNLTEKDNNTLYFVSNTGANTGKLYLGDKLISGDGSGASATSLADLTDIVLTELADKQVLTYQNGKWINATLEAIAAEIMTGATESTDGISGLVPVPSAGEQNKFLRGDGTWAEFDTSSFDQRVGNLETLLNGSDEEPTTIGLITTVGNLDKIINGYQDTEGNPVEGLHSVVANLVETVQDFDVSKLNTRVGTLEGIINDYTDPDSGETTFGLNTRVTKIEERISWGDMVE